MGLPARRQPDLPVTLNDAIDRPMNHPSRTTILLLAWALIWSGAAAFRAEWRQYRSFGGATFEGDIRTIISDTRFVYAFSSVSGARYDKLFDQWDFSFIGHLPPGSYQFAALDHYFNDLYFVYADKMIPYRLISDMQNPAIYLPEAIIRVAFDGRGIWVQTSGGYYLCDRWSGKCNKNASVPQQLEWFGRVDAESLRSNSRLYFLAQPIWDSWAGRHYLTAYATEFAGNYAWAAYSGLGLWKYDLITKEKTQLTSGFLASTGVAGLYASGGTVGMTGPGGVTLVDAGRDHWQQLNKLFNLDLTGYSLNCLAFDDKKIFIGTDRGIIVLKRGDDFASTLTRYDGLPDDAVTALLLQSDTLWIGTRYGPAVYLIKAGRKAESWEGQEDRTIHQMAADQRFLYLATSRGGLMLDRTDSLKIFRYDASSPPELDEEILGVAVDGAWVWWLAPDLLMRYDRKNFVWEKYPRAGNYNAGRALCLAVDDRNLWIGTDAGLVRLNKDKNLWTVYRKEDGLLNDYVTSLASVDGALWIGGETGLTKFFWK